MEKYGSRRSEQPDRKVKRLDNEIVERICPLCDGVGYIVYDRGHNYTEACERCEGLGVVYAEE